jgi:hypothetical protein
MTEAEWVTAKLPLYMLRECPAKWDERKARLFTCACLRGARAGVLDDVTWALVDAAERNPANDDDQLFPAMEQVLADRASTDRERVVPYRDGFVLVS